MTRRIGKILPAVLWLTMGTATPVWSVEVGEPLPPFAVRTFGGELFSRATLEGKPALLVFWNTWCSECRRELPEINRLTEKFEPGSVTVLAVNTGINDSEKKARGYWKKHGYGFPVGFDADFEIAQAFGVRGVPTIFLVDAAGIVRYKQSRLPENMAELINQLSAGKGAATGLQ